MKHLILTVLILSAFIFGCKKKETTTTPAPASSTTGGGTTTGGSTIDINSVPQATFVLDGVSKSYVSNNSTIYSGSSNGSSGNDNFVYGSGLDDGNLINYISIEKGTLVTGGSGNPTDAVFKAFFSVGTKSYSPSAANGIEIAMYDANGVSWSTSLGSQTGSTFTIDQIKDNPDLAGNFYLTVKVSFSCKLYNASGNVKVLTNGVYVGDFGNF
jgi:hypothetical protein